MVLRGIVWRDGKGCWSREIIACVLLLTVVTGVYGQQTWDYATGVRGTRLWIPPNVETVKGILIYGNGAGGDSRNEVFTPWNQAFATAHEFAIIGTSMWGTLSGSEIATWESHLNALASASGRPELRHAPWAPIGFSNGGAMSYGFNALRPEKTIAFAANKGCCYNDRLPSAESLHTPGLLIAGELDTATRRDSIRGLFNDNRPRGALWSWVEEEGEAHSGRADALLLPFFSEAIRLRYPADALPTATSGVTLLDIDESVGWLTDHSSWKSGLTTIAPFDDYPAAVRAAGWLPNENTAFLYRAFSTYDHRVELYYDLDLPGSYRPEVWGGYANESTGVTLDLTQLPDWTKVQVYNYATLIHEIVPAGASPAMIDIRLPIPSAGVYGFSALVTHADGVTQSVSNLLAFTAFPATVPEPTVHALLLTAACSLSYRPRSNGGVGRS